MATVKTIESSFDSMTEEQKKANLTSVGYIKNLASMTHTDINRWDILKIFGNGDGANLLLDKKEINKIFFEKLSKMVDKKSEEIADIDQIPELAAALERSFKESFDQRKQDVAHSISETLRSIESRNSQLAGLMQSLAELQKQYSCIALNTEPLTEIKREIQEVLKAGYWINPVVHGGFLYLNTASNIRLTHKNRAAGIDCELDVGQVAVRINLSHFYMEVIPYKNNIVYTQGGRFYHPHVNSNGQICWGNALQTMENHMKTFQLGKILQLLFVLLTSYNDSAPYVHLISLRDNNKKYSRIPTNLKHPEKIKVKAEPGELPEKGEFEVGDEVEFEASNYRYHRDEPRWNFAEDRGGGGRFVQGRVEEVAGDHIRIRYYSGSVELDWNWPLPGNHDYREDQWDRPGYLRHVGGQR